jgi:hypothetical protein
LRVRTRDPVARRGPLLRQCLVRHGFCEQTDRLGLPEPQPLLAFDHLFHAGLVTTAVDLCPGGKHRRPLGPVEHPHLQYRTVRDAPHLPAQRVDFAHQLPFGSSTDAGIAGHIGDRVEVHPEQQGFTSQPGCRECGFTPRMSRADHITSNLPAS